jgi:glycosyltransferase involved in cell wall biosynthesis
MLPGETGGRETHVRELARELASAEPGLELISFVNRETAGSDGLWRQLGRVVRLPLSPRARAAWAWAELVAVPAAAARARVDLLHSPANFGPVAGPFARVLTVHDLLFRRLPELLTPAMRLGTEALLPPAARRAHRVITVSRASRDDLVELLRVPADRIDTVPNGWTPPRAPGDRAAARWRLDAGDRRIALSVASDLPHKNLGALLEAVAQIPASRRPLLVLAGHGTDTGGLRERALGLGVLDDVRLVGALSAAELEDAYAAADVLVTATLFEGFGLPVLEGMGRGLPVACSDLPVLREVAGDAAAWLDPRDPATIARALEALLAGGPEVERMRAAGSERARRFSWRAAAAATVESYRRALSERA